MISKSTFFVVILLLCFYNSLFSTNSAPPPPANDICSGAIDLGLIECEFYALFSEDLEATPDPEATGNCITNAEPAQWYTFTTMDPLEYGTISHFSPTAKIEIFTTTSDCSDLVYVDCGSGPFGFKPEPATTYYYLTTGGLHIQPPSSGLSGCDDVLANFNFTQSPLVSSSYTDCAGPSADVNCQNDHVIWFGYTVGCGESSDVLISVSDFANDPSITANELSITVALFDCSILLSEYDEEGLGYRCSGIVAGESINLIDVPPGLSFVIGIGSDDYNAGYFDLHITETTNFGTVLNDECLDSEEVEIGLNTLLFNTCSMPDLAIPECGPQSEATVWYDLDPGTDLQNILISVLPIGIENPAIAVYDACGGNLLGSICGTELEIECIDFPIIIQIGSSLEDAGLFDLEIESNTSLPPLEPIITGNNICSEEQAGITIEIPGGEIVDIIVEVAPWSSIAVNGMTPQSFLGVNSATINDVLFNSSSIAQEATYLISVNAPEGYCSSDQIEFSIMVYPGFTVNEFSLDECLPFILDIDVSQLITGGTMPYASTTWFWNSTEILGTDFNLTVELEESGLLILEVVDGVGCTKSTTVDIELSPTITPTFDFPLIYCRSKQDIIQFPLMSLESIPGTWSAPYIDLNVFFNDGTYNTIFTADNPHCIVPVVVSVQIHSGDDPVFDLPDIICSEELEFIFPVMDLNGLEGTWEFPMLDVSTLTGTQTNTFIPISEDCYAPYEYSFEVPEKIVLDFGQPDNLCRIDEPYTLSNLSLDGYEGVWDVPIIDPSLVPGSNITCTWTPLEGQFPCLYDTSIIVEISEPILPEFDLPNELCALDEIYTLPTIDIQALSGTWSVPDIIPDEITGSIQSIFTPDDYCVEMFTWEIEIIEPLIPEFTIDTFFCSLDTIFTLPLISNNGIAGTWSIPTIDPSAIGGEQVQVIFQGEQIELCIEPVEVTFEVMEAEDVIFTLPEKICWTDEDLLLPTISENGIEGNWTPPFIDIQANIGTIVSSTFMPSDGSCSNVAEQIVEVIAPYEIETIEVDPSGCEIQDGSIQVDVIQGDGLEFSIDDGMNWQSTVLFNGLGPGGYTILVRSSDLLLCELEVETFLNTNDGPTINNVLINDINNCIVANGSIIVDAEGIDLDFSIDGGVNWQTSNEFTGLMAGDYVIIVRELVSDCIVEVNASILDFPQTLIVGVNAQDLSDCNLNDGSIEIVADGEALEYSIDNGLTWSNQNTFNDLADGTFEIIVQSTIGEDCSAATSVEILSPSAPIIVNLDSQNPTPCDPSIGRIEIEATGDNLEYSIDGSLTWQSSNIFLDVEAGVYTIVVRDSERINCFDEASIEILLEDESLPESTFIITPPSECDFVDAVLEVVNGLQDIEYSIDGGMMWQESGVFENLSAGTYVVITRLILLPDCLIEQTIDIPNSKCPCNELSLEFMISNVSCEEVEFARVDLISILGMNNPDIDVTWQNGETGNSIEGIEEGWQIATIEYDDDCIWKDSIWVDFIKPIAFEWKVNDLDCPDVNNGIIEIVNASGGNGTYEYSLDGVNYQSGNNFTELEEGLYRIYVRDDVDCLTTSEVEIISHEMVEISLPEIESITIGDRIILDPGIDLADIDSFTWSPIDGISNPNELIINVSPTISTIYTLYIYYGECIESGEVLIQVSKKEEIEIGNVFSPNADNNNDIFYIKGKSNSTIELNNFSVFDRWGNMVFDVMQPEFNNKADGWSGYYHEKLVTSGVYVYLINYTQNGEQELKVGTVTILY